MKNEPSQQEHREKNNKGGEFNNINYTQYINLIVNNETGNIEQSFRYIKK